MNNEQQKICTTHNKYIPCQECEGIKPVNTPDMVKIYSNGAGGGNGPASGSGGAGGECATFRKLPTFIEVSGNDGATPDNRPEAVLDRILEKTGHTPDTEWEKDFFEYFKGNIDGESNLHCNTKYIRNFIQQTISSHTTYWKERVRKEWQKGYDEGVVSAQSRVMENTFILTDSCTDSCMWEANKQNGTRAEHCIEVVDKKTGQVRYIATGSRVKFIEGNITEVHTQEKYNEEQAELDTPITNEDNLK